MKKILYLIVSRQTLFNKRKIIQGSCDSPLTESGKKQAKILSIYFEKNNIKFSHAYCSTQERASDTLEIITHNKIPYTRLKGLKEWNFGLFEGESKYLIPKFPYNDFFVSYGGENSTKVQNRMNKTLTEIMKKDDNKNALVVSHEKSCSMFFLKWAKDNFENISSQNCTIFKYEFENEKFNFLEVIQSNFDI